MRSLTFPGLQLRMPTRSRRPSTRKRVRRTDSDCDGRIVPSSFVDARFASWNAPT